LHGCLVTSTRAHARIVAIDCSEAEKSFGFVAFFSAKDVVGSNLIGFLKFIFGLLFSLCVNVFVLFIFIIRFYFFLFIFNFFFIY
jgi:xanthine dehydrogenase molybdopterin-binding subunit B